MKLVLGLVFSISSMAIATTTTIKVSGMHCGGCEKMVDQAVCKNAALKSTYSSCKVKLIDEKNQIGEITFEADPSQTVDQAQVQTLLTATDENYKIIPKKLTTKTKKN